MQKLISLFGLILFLAIAFLLSNNKKKIDWKVVGKGLIAQVVVALLLLKIPAGQKAFSWLNGLISRLLDFTKEGSKFLFGNLMDTNAFGYIFCVQVLPTIIFFCALTSVLYYLGIMQAVVSFIGKIMLKLLGTSGSESLVAAANIFLGQTEAPLLVKPYLNKTTKSEMFSIMTAGMATVSCSVMAGYVSMGANAGHIVTASVMSAIGSLVISKMLIPETEESQTKGSVKLEFENTDKNVIDAAARGTSEGLSLALNVGAMLISFIAIIALLNAVFHKAGTLVGINFLSLEWIFSRLFAPIAWLIGVPAQDIISAGNLLGQKLVINEFFAYASMSPLIKSGEISTRTITLLTYALCSFGNFSSIAMQIAGLGGMAKDKRSEIATLGMKALLGATLVSLITASIVGIII